MSIEQEVFQRMSIDRHRLVPYGFQKRGDGYFYSEVFMEGSFRADVFIGGDGDVSGKVFDLDTDEEYPAVHIESRGGAYVGEVRQAYAGVLSRIAEACFVKEPFLYEQSNHIVHMIQQRYGEMPDRPFKKLPGCGVFRYPANNKWYGLVMNIRKSLLAGEEDSSIVEVLNLKADTDRIGQLLTVPGIYPGYHMKRANWISILLDGSLPDEQIMELVDASRNYAVNAGKKRLSPASAASWIVPANPKYYDIEAAFQEGKDILWKQSSKVRAGDVVYLYVAAPVSAVRYKCRVVETDIPYAYQDGNISMSHVMKMRLLKTYPADQFSFEVLKTLGITTVRGPRLAPESFLERIEGKGEA